MSNYIGSVSQFTDIVINDTKFWNGKFSIPWFRGQQKGPLLPKIYHNGYNRLKENSLVQEFRMRALALYDFTPEYDRIDEWLFLMEHSLLPTRLLDWSEGALIALFFSIGEFEKHNQSEPVVWMLNPIIFNKYLNDMSELPLSWNDGSYIYPLSKNKNTNNLIIENINGVRHERLNCSGNFCAAFGDNDYEQDSPLALKPQHVHERVAVQRGCFTIHGKIINGLECFLKDKIFNESDYINVFKGLNCSENNFNEYINNKSFNEVFLKEYQINPDKNILKEMIRNLSILGISDSTLFPDIDGLSRELTRKYNYIY